MMPSLDRRTRWLLADEERGWIDGDRNRSGVPVRGRREEKCDLCGVANLLGRTTPA
jgi:hypothetical protein